MFKNWSFNKTTMDLIAKTDVIDSLSKTALLWHVKLKVLA